MAWPLLDPIARDEMVADQFLNGLDSHELRVQVAATGIRRIENLMHVARSLEAVENPEAGHGRPRQGSNKALFSEGEGPETDRIVDQLLAQLGPELRQSRDPEEAPTYPGAATREKCGSGSVSRSPEGAFQEQRSRKDRRMKPGTLTIYR